MKKRLVSKGKKKVTGRGDYSIQKQHQICKDYIKKDKDLTKLKAYLRKQIAKSKNTYSMPRTKQTPTKAQRQAAAKLMSDVSMKTRAQREEERKRRQEEKKVKRTNLGVRALWEIHTH